MVKRDLFRYFWDLPNLNRYTITLHRINGSKAAAPAAQLRSSEFFIKKGRILCEFIPLFIWFSNTFDSFCSNVATFRELETF